VSKQFVNTMDDDIRRRHILRGASIVALINGLFIYWPPSIEMGASVCNTFGPDIAFWLWLVLAPLLWSLRVPSGWFEGNRIVRFQRIMSADRPFRLNLVCVCIIGLVSLLVSWHTATRPFTPPRTSTFANSPPLIHDEYSYLLQADTYLGGRLFYPSHAELPELFNAMHILNEGKYASRYFPGTGLWIVPFRWLGESILGYWLAGALICAFVFLVGRELVSTTTGFIAGILTACSPGMAIFGNLHLSHHPTLLGLMPALWCAARLINARQREKRNACLMGVGLGWALLCRPLTAVAWGGVLVPWVLLSRVEATKEWSLSWKQTESLRKLLLVIGGPILIALLIHSICNQQITGDWWTTPYTQYQEVYTPCHRYGFNNVERGSLVHCEKSLRDYDGWAENLTPTLALRHAERRYLGASSYTLNTFVVGLSVLPFFVYAVQSYVRLLLLPGLIASVHLIYFPYWYEGILGWHYVFETLPIWALIVACTTDRNCRIWWRESRLAAVGWWFLLLIVSVCANFWGGVQVSSLARGLSSFSVTAERYMVFRSTHSEIVTHRPALIIVEPGPSDLHIEYVVNHPALDSDELIVRKGAGDIPLDRIRRAWPDRWIYLVQMETNSGVLLAEPIAPGPSQPDTH
jgi:hypothetical protein